DAESPRVGRQQAVHPGAAAAQGRPAGHVGRHRGVPPMSQTESTPSSRDPLDRLAESFLERFRRGERPSLTEYIEAHPALAPHLGELSPALVELEGLKSGPAPGEPARALGLGEPARGPHPARLGDYQILSVIGEGGMGIVYEAEHQSLKSR